ncbi:MAG: putative membrane protein [Gammaproteobacteria bacterium]|jgi:uncharacterized membrane protein
MKEDSTPVLGFWHRSARTFLAGLLAVLPLALTLAVLVWLVDFIHDLVGPRSLFGTILGAIGLKLVASELVAYIIGAVITALLIYILGLLVEAGMKNRLNALVENLVERVPLVRSIYSALKQVLHMFENEANSELKAMGSVLCHFGGRGGTVVLGLMPNARPIHMNGIDYYGILLPTAPVPFGGALLYVPVDWVELIDMPFDTLANVYMSMGATAPDYFSAEREGQTEKGQGAQSDANVT